MHGLRAPPEGAPETDLVDKDLLGDGQRSRAGDLGVEEVVEEVPGRAVHESAERCQLHEAGEVDLLLQKKKKKKTGKMCLGKGKARRWRERETPVVGVLLTSLTPMFCERECSQESWRWCKMACSWWFGQALLIMADVWQLGSVCFYARQICCVLRRRCSCADVIGASK